MGVADNAAKTISSFVDIASTRSATAPRFSFVVTKPNTICSNMVLGCLASILQKIGKKKVVRKPPQGFGYLVGSN